MIVKVCGMRDADNIRAVEKTGVDWMGFIFHPHSPRFVTVKPSYLPQRCKRVGVFVNASMSDMLQRVHNFGLNLVQLHGSETPAFCHHLRNQLPDHVQIIKMIPVSTESDLLGAEKYIHLVDYFLFETKQLHSAGHYGGSGQQFDWQLLSAYSLPLPFLVTGGIGHEDAELLQQFHHPQCIGIDINSRFEIAPALKDAALIRQFIHNIQSLNTHH